MCMVLATTHAHSSILRSRSAHLKKNILENLDQYVQGTYRHTINFNITHNFCLDVFILYRKILGLSLIVFLISPQYSTFSVTYGQECEYLVKSLLNKYQLLMDLFGH